MRPRPFMLHRPKTLKEASELLYSHEDAKPLAGGQSLIPMMKLRIFSPEEIVLIGHLPEMQPGVRQEGNTIVINSMTTHDMVHHDELISEHLPALSEAAAAIADQQIRNRGTIGGNIAHGDPSTNLSAALLALDAKVVVNGKDGQREIPINEFFLDLFTTALEHDEIITGFKVDIPKNSKQKFMKITRSDTAFPLAFVAVNVQIADGVVKDAKFGLGVAAPTPIRAKEAEDYIKNKPLNQENILKAAEIATKDLEPPGDVHASPEYRKNLLNVLMKRCLNSIIEGAKQ